MTRQLLAVFALVVLASSARAGDAASKPAPRDAFKTRTRSVAVFKDGYGFFLRQGQAFLRDGWCMTDFIPKAAAGTFWLYTSEPGTTVTTVRSTARNEIRFESPAELVRLLDGKVGLQVKVETEDGPVEGELNRVLDDMILVRTLSDTGRPLRIIELADISKVQILGQPLLMKVEGSARPSQVTVNIGYLQSGITWVPSYIAELLGSGRLRLTLRGTVTNGLEDLRDCAVYLVVGVPNFVLKDQLDPLTVHALGSAVASSLAPRGSSAGQVFRNAPADTENLVVLEPAASVPNTVVEGLKELYYYELKGLDMSAGDVVMSTVMTGEVSYRSLYVWNSDAGQEVMHYMVLRNSLASPLTTGSVMVLDKGRPVSQDQITYTPVSGECRVKLTVAGDVRGEASDVEIERRPQEEIMHVAYIPVESECRLTVFNRKNEAVDVEITRRVAGRVISVSDNGEAKSQTKTDDGLNPETSLKWTVKVEPGKDRSVTCRYLRYVRAAAR